jgi:hypothetical protein
MSTAKQGPEINEEDLRCSIKRLILGGYRRETAFFTKANALGVDFEAIRFQQPSSIYEEIHFEGERPEKSQLTEDQQKLLNLVNDEYNKAECGLKTRWCQVILVI